MSLLLRQWLPLRPPLSHKNPNFNLSTKHCNVRQRKTTSYVAATGVDTFTEKSGYLFQLSESEAESLSEYDVARIGSIYRRKPIILGRRLFQMGTTLGKWFLLRYIDGLMDRADAMFKVLPYNNTITVFLFGSVSVLCICETIHTSILQH